ncbi:MAG: hypothetical protein JST59_25715 [Actinobacteria bacterium]|nr:hypothetical protein [Actinomycetota bacterium]
MIPLSATSGSWLQFASTLVAAAAAVASWAAVLQTRRLVRDSRLPVLHIEVGRTEGTGAVDGTAAVTVLNAGNALATRVGFFVITPDALVQASLGFLRPDEIASFATDLQIDESFQALAYGRSQDGEEYAWDYSGDRRRVRSKGPLPTWEEILDSFYPGVDFSGRQQATVLRSA